MNFIPRSAAIKSSGGVNDKRKQITARHQQPLASASASNDLFADLPGSHSAAPSVSDGLFGDLPSSSVNKVSSQNLEKVKEQEKKDENVNLDLKRKGDSTSIEPDPSPAKRPAIDLYHLHGTYAERKGEREEMQDKHVLMENFVKNVPDIHPSISRLAFFAVYDGHAGAKTAQYAAQHLHVNLAHKFPRGELSKVENDMKRCLIETYRKTDEDFLKIASKSKPSWKDGSTATTVLVINNTLYIANLGDSRAILCRFNEKEQKHVGITLSTDHSPSDYTERMRIQKAGGTVREGRVMGVLEVSRSLGDGPYKRHGVTCLPDVKRCQLTDNDRWILIACDGLWKTFNNEEAVKAVNHILNESPGKEGQPVRREEQVCNKLANDAVRRLGGDNVTVLLITIQKHEHKH